MGGKKKKKATAVTPPRDDRLVIKADHTRRRMSPEELRVYLRESGRGCGVHGVESNKTKRRKARQAFKKEDYDK